MRAFENSKWIWISNGGGNDEYGEFYDTFDYTEGNVKINISVDGDYTLFVNGSFAASNQFGDFVHYKIYDTVDVTNLLKNGKNTVSVLVWHFGAISMRYRPAAAGLIYEVVTDNKVLAVSDESTLSRKSPSYQNGRCKNITPQLGPGFAYDATKEDGAIFNGNGFASSAVVDKKCDLYPRVGSKLVFDNEKKTTCIKNEDGRHYLIDLGEETVGVPVLRFNSSAEQDITVAWGEHIIDGCVRRKIASRDFSFEYHAKKGKNCYVNYMLRLGLRYIEVFASEPIEVDYIGVLPQYYPVGVRNVSLESELDKRIYDLCVKTLQLSMMEHYVDCPWREQCLYVLDSRNQMLCGYYAFENGNAEYVKANLSLMVNDTRADGILSITYPSGNKLAIPSFSLHLYTSMYEYYQHTGDAKMLKYAYPKLKSVLEAFIANRENGLLKKFDGDDRWNFYDWSDNLEGKLGENEANSPDLVCNCLFINALDKMKLICEAVGEEYIWEDMRAEAVKCTREAFFNAEKGIFTHVEGKEIYTALGNALAIGCGLCSGDEADVICRAIVNGTASECSLSLKPFVYDALLETDPSYKSFILDEIRRNYKKMLDDGATSAWETIDGAAAFSNAGSLCHGWSAIPVCYFNKFGMIKEN